MPRRHMMQVDTRATRGRGLAVTDATTGSNAARRSHPEGDTLTDPEGTPANVACRRACGSGACHSRREGTRVGYGHGGGGGCARRPRKTGLEKRKPVAESPRQRLSTGPDKGRTTAAKPPGKRTTGRQLENRPRSVRADIGSAHERRRGERGRGAMRSQVTAMKRVPRRNPPGERQTNEQAKREGTTSSREGQHKPRRTNPPTTPAPENLSPRKEPSTAARAARLPRQRSTRESARRPRTRPNRERPARPAPTGSRRA